MRIIRVTDVLSIVKEPDYEKFRERMGEERYEEVMSVKAEEGKLLHHFFSEILMEGDITKKEQKLYPQYEYPVGLLKLWVQKNVERVLFSEMRYTSDALSVSGQIDAGLLLKGRVQPSLIDLKCVAKITKKTPVQIAGGYTLVTKPLKWDGAIALHLHKKKVDGKIIWDINAKNEWPAREFPKWQGLFLQALGWCRYLYDGKEVPDGEEDY